jgi:hypothetical protein
VLAFTNDTVTGAAATSIIPNPTTSPVFSGELPSRKSPCEEESANTIPLVVREDWDVTHQFISYLPASLKVISPVAGL